MKYKKELILVLLIALILRLGPVALHGMPLSYDAPYHINTALEIQETGDLPGNYNYAPFYHILLVVFSELTSLPVFFLGMVLLPLFSSLTVVSVFLFVRRFFGERRGVVASFLIALAMPLLAAAFDSPENIALFLLPLSLLLSGKRKFLASLLFVLNIFWNYFTFLVSALPFLIYFGYKRDFRMLFYSIGLGLLAIIFQWYFGFFDNLSLESGMQFIAHNLQGVSFTIAVGSLFVLPVIIYGFRKKSFSYWFFFSIINFLGVVSIILTPVLRAWEFAKFLTLGMVFVIAENFRLENLRYLSLLFAVLLFFALIWSNSYLYPKVSKVELNGIEYLEEAYIEGFTGKILAEPSMSEHIKMRTGLEDYLVNSLHYESSNALKEESLKYLIGDESKGFLERAGIQYLVLNFEDDFFRERDYSNEFNQIYSLGYERKCMFQEFLPETFEPQCGFNEFRVLEVR